ncbi:MAG: hypothetical protein LC648_01350 [Novosphingobium sp.]|nr:hypothetical protein [Novosphingobium sp.]
MKRIIAIAALASVAACSERAAAPEPTSEAAAESTTAAVAETVAADGKPSVGTYKVTTSDGKVFMEEVKADGTYVQTQDGKVVETGKWVQKSPSQYCYTKDAEGAKEKCNTEQVDANGVWTSVDPEGKTATVERVTA